MKRIILLISLLLLPAAWAFTQEGQYGHEGDRARANVSVEGCLYGEPGNLTLVDNQGNTFQLTGRTERLDGLTGRRVRLQGRAWTDRDGRDAMAGNQDENLPTLRVFGVQHVSRDRCDEGGAGINIQVPRF